MDGRLLPVQLGPGAQRRRPRRGARPGRHAAALLGIAAASEAKLLDEILEFSELGSVVDAPVSTYSSGMRARLGFAVAAQLRPDLLLIDEALAVGDFSFRRKCIRHLVAAVERGQSLLLVSHDLYSLQILCRRAIYLVDGRVAFDGPTAEAVDLYVEAQRDPVAPAAAAGTTFPKSCAPPDEPASSPKSGRITWAFGWCASCEPRGWRASSMLGSIEEHR